MEQIIKEKLGKLSASYLEMIAKEMVPSRMVIVGTSTSDVKMERPMEDQKVNFAYWYHSQWRDVRFGAQSFEITSFKLEINQKNNKGNARWVLPLRRPITKLFSRACGRWQSKNRPIKFQNEDTRKETKHA
jgi:hypothetical protein